jgi:hypothetical protein
MPKTYLKTNRTDENSPRYPLILPLSPKGKREEKPPNLLYSFDFQPENKVLKKARSMHSYSPLPLWGGEDLR